MARPVSEWDLSDLQQLVDAKAEEGAGLEFKGSDALQNTQHNKGELAKDVSAMANAAGGVIVYGIAEAAGGIADHIDGGTDQTPEWIEQVLTSGIEPAVIGLMIKRIAVAGGRFAFAVGVPQATTLAPHQARHAQRYYRRHNVTVLAMLDHEIRDLMRRGTTPELRLDFSFQQIGDSDRFTVKAHLINRSAAPAFYYSIDVYLETSLNIPSVEPGYYPAAVPLDIPGLYKGGGVRLTRNFGVPDAMPIFAERAFRALEAVFVIPQSTHYFLAYHVACPGFRIDMVGRIYRQAVGWPYVELKAIPFNRPS